jgi:hypothetical protein
MVNLLELSDDVVSWTVRITKKRGEGSVELTGGGLSFDAIYYLLRRFPQLLAPFYKKTLSAEEIANMPASADIIAEMAACATGAQGDAKAIANAKKLSAAKQLEIAEKIWDATFEEDGLLPFVERYIRMQGKLVQQPAASATSEPSEKSSAISWSADLVGTPRPMRRRRRPDASPPGSEPMRPSDAETAPSSSPS